MYITGYQSSGVQNWLSVYRPGVQNWLSEYRCTELVISHLTLVTRAAGVMRLVSPGGQERSLDVEGGLRQEVADHPVLTSSLPGIPCLPAMTGAGGARPRPRPRPRPRDQELRHEAVEAGVVDIRLYQHRALLRPVTASLPARPVSAGHPVVLLNRK